MGDASNLQTNFQGGEWSPFYLGRMEDPAYRTALSKCLNALPVEEGAWTRRPGTRFCAPTYRGWAGVLRSFHFNLTNPYNVELTNGGIARIFDGPGLVLDSRTMVSSISSASPAVIETMTPHGWATGDEIEFFRDVSDSNFTPGLLLGCQFIITVIDSTHFSIVYSYGGAAFDGSTITLGNTALGVGRVLHLAHPYGLYGSANGLDKVKLVQGPDFAVLLHPKFPPQVLATLDTPSATSQGTFRLQPASFSDGPYLDIPGDGSTITPSGTTGSITITYSIGGWDSGTTYSAGDVVNYNGLGYTSLAGSNIGNQPDISSSLWQLNVSNNGVAQSGFLATDIGRAVRLFSEPAAYNAGTSYSAGQTVKYADTYWTSLTNANSGNQPDISPSDWEVAPGAAQWTWGLITAVAGTTSATLKLYGGDLLNTGAISTYRLGLYSVTTGFPSCGCYQEGRLWLGGLVPNRLDSSKSLRPFDFAPTATDGTVADDNAISATFQSETNNAIYWLHAETSGIIIGTKAGEYLATASNLNDLLTPSSIQIRRTSKFGCDDVLPVRAPLALLFVERHGRKLVEYISDVYSGKYSGTNIAKKAGHLAARQIVELAYQQEVTPTVWMRMADGSLVGAVYKRESPFGTQPAEFVGWFDTALGSGRTVLSLQQSQSQGGDLDAIALVTQDPTTGLCWVELSTDQIAQTADITQSWFVDAASPPTAMELTTGNTVLKLAGYYHLAGQTVQPWIAGLDCGDIVVAADGTITIPFTANSLLTLSWLQTVTTEAETYPWQVLSLPYASDPGATPDLNTIFVFNQNASTGVINAPDYTSIGINWEQGYALSNPSSHDGLYKFGLNDGQEFQYQTYSGWYSTLYNSDGTHPSEGLSIVGAHTNGNAIALFPSIDAFAFLASGTNYGVVRKANLGSLSNSTIKDWGISSEGGLSGPYRIPGGGSIISLPSGGRNYALTLPIYTISAGVCHGIDVDNWLDFTVDGSGNAEMQFGPSPGGHNTYWLTGCRGRTINSPYFNYTEAYVQTWLGSGTPGWYPVSLGYGQVIFTATGNGPAQKVGSVAGFNATFAIIPTDIVNFPGVQINAATQPIFDPLDNCIITAVGLQKSPAWNSSRAFLAQEQVTASDNHAYLALSGTTNVDPTTDGGVHWQDLGDASGTLNTAQLIKVDPVTQTVKWATTLPGIPSFSTQTRLTGRGVLCIMLAGQPLQIVNTATGALTTGGSIAGISTIYQHAYDDVTGAMVVSCNYSKSTGPQPGPGTPDSWSERWAVLPGLNQTSSVYTFPALVGFTYTSQGQQVRAVAQQETGAANGPALGKTRRQHQYSMLLSNTQGISVGTDLSGTLYAPTLAPYENGSAIPLNQLYSGVIWDTLENDYSYDGMIAWQVTRPYPANVLAVGGFIHAQDR